ncbi:hypothetical protein [Aureimonas frigidaquae]|uniref:hypothetical protein n=1 Tax=Aureimonas frigidaquae TaxID=424757 RepID=UPI0012ED00A7|nr:hypothetical protein [Aureimonas frigidaquae]
MTEHLSMPSHVRVFGPVRLAAAAAARRRRAAVLDVLLSGGEARAPMAQAAE